MATGIFNLKQQLQGLIQKAWTGTQKTNYVEYLVVAGGGSGGSTNAGGGGGGGLLSGILPITPSVTLTVTVGGGGAGGSSGAGVGASGANSVFSSITSTGGGAGGSNSGSALNGGSGGGDQGGYAGLTPGQGIVGQGNNGGGGNISGTGTLSPNYPGSGGGGAGAVGSSITSGSSQGQNGGAGIASTILGTSYTFSGGGGGAAYNGANGGNGGVGGGGGGGSSSGTPGTGGTGYNSGSNAVVSAGGAGGVNAGGGAGGGRAQATGAAGGSGIVIISYPDTYNAPTALTGTYTASTSGSGSSYFNGSTYADYPASTNNFATGDFTIEAWVYYNSFTSGYTLWFTMDPNTTYFGPTGATTTKLNLGTGGELSWTTSTISLSTWYHTAVVRSGTTITLYINGVSQGTNTSSNTLGVTAGAIRIGSAAGYALNGYLSNLRYTKSAVYTSAFTPSTAPLPSLANTRLLLNTVSPSPFNDSSGIAQTPTVTGTSSWNQLSPFATGLGYKNRVYTWTASGTVTF